MKNTSPDTTTDKKLEGKLPIRGKYATDIAKKIIHGPYEGVRQKIAQLFIEEGQHPKQIVESLNGTIVWPKRTNILTRTKRVREVLRFVLDPSTRISLQRERARINLHKQSDKAAVGRNKWMQREEMVVWSDDEIEYFLKLMKWKEMWRTETRLNHEKLAAEMNRYCGKGCFKMKVCMDALLRFKHVKKMSIPTFADASDIFDRELKEDVLDAKKEGPIQGPNPEMIHEAKEPKNQTPEQILARKIAQKLMISGHRYFAPAAAYIVVGDWNAAANILLLNLQKPKRIERWTPVQHEFFALVLMGTGKHQYIQLAEKHLELGKRVAIDGKGGDGLFDEFALPAQTSAEVLSGKEGQTNGRYAGKSRHAEMRH